MNNKKLFGLIVGIFLLISAFGFVGASNFKFENSTGTNLMKLYGTNGNLSVFGNVSSSGYFVGSGKYLTDIDTSALNLSGINYWTKSGTDLFYNSGNVGIGTTSPVNKLTFGTRGDTISMDTSDTADNKYLGLAGGGTLSNSRGALIILGGNEDATYPGNLLLRPGSGAGSYVEIDQTLYAVDGNVGIGTTSPQSKLDVFDNTDNSAIDVRTYTGGLDITSDQGASSYGLLRFRGWTGAETLSSSDGTYIQSITNGNNDIDLAFGNYVSGGTITEIMRLKQNGNVGIGTTSPTTKLDILGGNLHFSGGGQSDYGREFTLWYNSSFPYTGHIADYTLSLDTGNNYARTSRIYIDKGGNVGIGTTSPGQRLEVSSGNILIDNNQWYMAKNTSGTATNLIKLSTGNNLVLGIGGGYILPETAGASSFGSPAIPFNNLYLQGVIKATGTGDSYILGNVGIGTTSPGKKLEISETSDNNGLKISGYDDRSSDYLSQSISADGSSYFHSSKYMRFDSENAGYYFDMPSGGSFRWRNSSNSVIGIFKENGNVGIGTTSPSQKLEVAGTFNATSSGGTLQVDSSGNVKIGL